MKKSAVNCFKWNSRQLRGTVLAAVFSVSTLTSAISKADKVDVDVTLADLFDAALNDSKSLGSAGTANEKNDTGLSGNPGKNFGGTSNLNNSGNGNNNNSSNFGNGNRGNNTFNNNKFTKSILSPPRRQSY